MTDTCDHCGRAFEDDEERNETADGTYCPGTCWYDANVLDADPDELPPRPPVDDVVGND